MSNLSKLYFVDVCCLCHSVMESKKRAVLCRSVPQNPAYSSRPVGLLWLLLLSFWLSWGANVFIRFRPIVAQGSFCRPATHLTFTICMFNTFFAQVVVFSPFLMMVMSLLLSIQMSGCAILTLDLSDIIRLSVVNYTVRILLRFGTRSMGLWALDLFVRVKGLVLVVKMVLVVVTLPEVSTKLL